MTHRYRQHPVPPGAQNSNDMHHRVHILTNEIICGWLQP